MADLARYAEIIDYLAIIIYTLLNIIFCQLPILFYITENHLLFLIYLNFYRFKVYVNTRFSYIVFRK